MRICLIGYGYWGKNLARVFGKDLVGICDYDQDNLDKAKKLYDVRYFSNHHELEQNLNQLHYHYTSFEKFYFCLQAFLFPNNVFLISSGSELNLPLYDPGFKVSFLLV